MKVLGIDPGLNGGLAVVSLDKLEGYMKMPLVNGYVDVIGVYDFVRAWEPELVAIENVHSMSSDGVVSAFTFGLGYGRVLGVVEILGLKILKTDPQEWQAYLKTITGIVDGEPKVRALAQAKMLWPRESFVLPKCRTPHEGVIDAALIAASQSMSLGEWRARLSKVRRPQVSTGKIEKSVSKLASFF